MQRISQILQQTKRKQVTGHYIQWSINNIADQAEIPEGYCAMGALFCEGGFITDSKKYNYPGSDSLLKKFGYSDEQAKAFRETRNICPIKSCKQGGVNVNGKPGRREATGSDMVVHLNDGHKWSFKRIGNWLESVGY